MKFSEIAPRIVSNEANAKKAKEKQRKIAISSGAIGTKEIIDYLIGNRGRSFDETIGDLQRETTYHFVTGGLWGFQDVLFYVIDKFGPISLYSSTWTMGFHVGEKVVALLNAGMIRESYFVFDSMIQNRKERVFHLIQNQEILNIRLTNNHSKVTVFEAEKISCVLVSSANHSNNPRVEAGIFSTVPAVANFHKAWILELHAGSQPFAAEAGAESRERIKNER